MRLVCYKKRKVSMVLLALAILLSGCSQKIPTSKIRDEMLISELCSVIRQQYPDKFKAVHHVALTVLGKSYVLNGFLMVNRSENELHLIAQNDMGGSLFELQTSKGKTRIHSKTEVLKTHWLEKSVLKDLEILYLSQPIQSAALSRNHDNNLILSESGQGIVKEYIFKTMNIEKGKYQLIGYKHRKNHRDIYTIAYLYNKKIDDKYPSSVTIKNDAMHYQVDITIQYFFSTEKTNHGSSPCLLLNMKES